MNFCTCARAYDSSSSNNELDPTEFSAIFLDRAVAPFVRARCP